MIWVGRAIFFFAFKDLVACLARAVVRMLAIQRTNFLPSDILRGVICQIELLAWDVCVWGADRLAARLFVVSTSHTEEHDDACTSVDD